MSPRAASFLLPVVLAAVVHGPAGAGADRAPVPILPRADGNPIVALRAAGPSRILIRAGTFTMGSTSDDIEVAIDLCKKDWHGADFCEKPFVNELEAHEVALSAYYIDRTEVTVADYRRCVELGRCSAPPFASGGQRLDRPDYPVTLVTWNDGDDYCRFAGGRLPTEAEWERAARGPSGRRFPWGNTYNQALCNHGSALIALQDVTDDRDGFAELAPVGSFPGGRTPDGIDDMAGNVEEWVQDAIDDVFGAHYPAADEVNPTGASGGAFRVVRGGAYGSELAGNAFAGTRAWMRGAARRFRAASERDHARGFRCVHPAVGL
jgi:formylglycine-generating enzyme required for sulfatase activity